ncbi:MAG: hypothetical protein AAF558_03495, partial [Verrucomicrobiota bacterium]
KRKKFLREYITYQDGADDVLQARDRFLLDYMTTQKDTRVFLSRASRSDHLEYFLLKEFNSEEFSEYNSLRAWVLKVLSRSEIRWKGVDQIERYISAVINSTSEDVQLVETDSIKSDIINRWLASWRFNNNISPSLLLDLNEFLDRGGFKEVK